MPIPLLALAISAFAIGTIEFVIMGLLPEVARDLAVSIPSAGLLVSGYALGVAFGAPPVAAVVAASLAGVAALVPSKHDLGPVGLMHEVRVLKDPQVWMALAMTIVGFGGVFVVFTYIVPILEQVSGFSPRSVTLILVLFGVGLTLGNTMGGKLADRAPMPSLMGILLALAVVMAIFTRTSHPQVAAAVTIFVWGIVALVMTWLAARMDAPAGNRAIGGEAI